MNKRYVLSISCGNYLFSNGGTDKVIRAQQALLSSNLISYVFLFPVKKQIGRFEIYGWGMNVDKEFCGVYSVQGIIKRLVHLKETNYECLQIHIHNLWRVRIPDIKRYIDIYDCDVKFYLHDYYSVCKQGNLMENGNAFCGEVEGICKNQECKFYDLEYTKEIRRFFEEYDGRFEYIAPSLSVKRNFQSIVECSPGKIRIVKHQKLIGIYKENWNKPLQKVRVAYVGTQTVNKGWREYKRIVEQLKERRDYEFLYIGIGKEEVSGVRNIYTSIQKNGDNAMLNSLRENRIDVVFLLSQCPETYSYTYFEAKAANCFVIAFENSGNIALEIENSANGKVFRNVDSLVDYFKSNSIRADIRDWYNRDEYGPLTLEDNDAILGIVLRGKKDTNNKRVKLSRTFFTRKLLLELVYRMRKMK